MTFVSCCDVAVGTDQMVAVRAGSVVILSLFRSLFVFV